MDVSSLLASLASRAIVEGGVAEAQVGHNLCRRSGHARHVLMNRKRRLAFWRLDRELILLTVRHKLYIPDFQDHMQGQPLSSLLEDFDSLELFRAVSRNQARFDMASNCEEVQKGDQIACRRQRHNEPTGLDEVRVEVGENSDRRASELVALSATLLPYLPSWK